MSENSLLLFDFDKSFNKKIVGTDEAGRGPGAGGVFAAAVYFEKINKVNNQLQWWMPHDMLS